MPYGVNATRQADMIVPEVWSSMVQAELDRALIWAQFATVDRTLEGQPGDTIHFPSFNMIGAAVDVAENEDVPVERMSTADDTATVKEAGKAVEVTDRAILYGMGDPLAEGTRQIGIALARKMDSDLVTDVTTNAAYQPANTAAPLSADAVADGLDLFGDGGVSSEFAAIVIHSKQHTALRKDDDFQRADTYGSGQVIVRGEVGRIYNIPVIVHDGIAPNPDGGGVGIATYSAVLLKNNALMLAMKRSPLTETDRDILARSNLVSSTQHYGTKLTDPEGAAVLTTQA